MVRACTTARRGWLCQTDLGGKRRWTTEQRKTEKEMDRRPQAQYGGPAAQRGGCRASSWMEKKNPCGWPFTWGIHSLKERERERYAGLHSAPYSGQCQCSCHPEGHTSRSSAGCITGCVCWKEHLARDLTLEIWSSDCLNSISSHHYIIVRPPTSLVQVRCPCLSVTASVNYTLA